jgi:hypothetical protein
MLLLADNNENKHVFVTDNCDDESEEKDGEVSPAVPASLFIMFIYIYYPFIILIYNNIENLR